MRTVKLKDRCSPRLPSVPFYPFLAFFLPFSLLFLFLFPFSSFFPLFPSFPFWPLFSLGFFFMSFYHQPTHLKFNWQLPSFVILRGFCAVYFLFVRVSSLPYYQLEPDIHRHGILTIWRMPRAWVMIMEFWSRIWTLPKNTQSCFAIF